MESLPVGASMMIIHENGAIDILRIDSEQYLHYAMLCSNIASQLIEQHKRGLENGTELQHDQRRH